MQREFGGKFKKAGGVVADPEVAKKYDLLTELEVWEDQNDDDLSETKNSIEPKLDE